MNGFIYPEQKTTLAFKSTKEFNKANADYWISRSTFDSAEYATLARLARMAEGEIDLADYKAVLNPFGVDDDKLKNFPSTLRNYNIITPIVNARLGERSRKPDNIEVIVTNADVTNKLKEELDDKVDGILNQMVINALNESQVKTGVPTQKVQDPNAVAAETLVNYNDKRAIFGQEALDYIKYAQDLKDKNQDQARDWYTYGRCFSYKDAIGGDVWYERVPVLESWVAPGTSKFIEDRDAFVWRKRMSINQIIDLYGDQLSEQDIEWLQNQVSLTPSPNNSIYLHSDVFTRETVDNNRWNFGYLSSGEVYLYHVTWKTLVKVGFLTYYDQVGRVQELEVDENYKFESDKGDISIDWQWRTITWETYRIGAEGGTEGNGIYFGGNPTKVQRDAVNPKKGCKLPFNGVVRRSDTGAILSMVKDGEPYQAIFNTYHYKREMCINRNKDKIMLMPMGLFPKEFGNDPVTAFLYYLVATGIGFFDETKTNASTIINSLKSIDMGLGTYIQEMSAIIEGIKQEWWDVVGFNRERYGQTYASDGKGKNEQAIFRSTIITAEEDRQFDKFVETEAQGNLDISKVAWIDGKTSAYITSDGRQAFFDVNGIDHNEADYGVFGKDNALEQERLNDFKTASFQMAQKGNMKASTIGNIIQGNNFSKVMALVKKAESLEDARLAEEAKAQQETEKYITDKQAEVAQKASEDTRYVADTGYDKAIEVALINADAAVLGYDKGEDGASDLDIIAQRADERKHEAEQRIKERQISLAERKQRADEEYDREKLKIDRTKANKPSSKS